MYDLIGDIHGHADALESLLQKMDYQKKSGAYAHPERKVIFLGDFLDRGPKISQVLETVYPMLESGSAKSVMGNHELNALAFHTPRQESPGNFLRPHSESNVKQHKATLDQVPSKDLQFHLAWIRKLPLWLDLDGLRVIHACWDEQQQATVSAGLGEHGIITDEFLHSACTPAKSLFAPLEVLLKGKEAKLPEGMSFNDADGHKRTSVRTKWYLPTEGHTYLTYALQMDPIHCDATLSEQTVEAASPYPANEKPVFIGHYWLTAPKPSLLAHNVACVDYSVAKGGFLCAYRWDGEKVLSDEKFEVV